MPELRCKAIIFEKGKQVVCYGQIKLLQQADRGGSCQRCGLVYDMAVLERADTKA